MKLKRPIKQSIEISIGHFEDGKPTKAGTRRVPAYVYHPQFAIHRRTDEDGKPVAKDWVISHIPTGFLASGSFPTMGTARLALDVAGSLFDTDYLVSPDPQVAVKAFTDAARLALGRQPG
jgi:hypothetical protein